MQLFVSANRVLSIVAQHGFGSEFLRYFDTVSDGGSACGAAMNRRCGVVIPNVASDPLFQEPVTKDMLLRANVCSVQSTPLTDRCGNFIGIVSTHYDRPRKKFSNRAWEHLDDVIAGFATKMLATQRNSCCELPLV